jgi:hypothetical protein
MLKNKLRNIGAGAAGAAIALAFTSTIKRER